MYSSDASWSKSSCASSLARSSSAPYIRIRPSPLESITWKPPAWNMKSGFPSSYASSSLSSVCKVLTEAVSVLLSAKAASAGGSGRVDSVPYSCVLSVSASVLRSVAGSVVSAVTVSVLASVFSSIVVSVFLSFVASAFPSVFSSALVSLFVSVLVSGMKSAALSTAAISSACSCMTNSSVPAGCDVTCLAFPAACTVPAHIWNVIATASIPDIILLYIASLLFYFYYYVHSYINRSFALSLECFLFEILPIYKTPVLFIIRNSCEKINCRMTPGMLLEMLYPSKASLLILPIASFTGTSRSTTMLTPASAKI